MHLVLQGAASAEERIEDTLAFLSWNAGSAVGNTNFDHRLFPVLRGCRENSNPASVASPVFYGIVQQSLESVSHSHSIGEHRRQAGFNLPFDQQTAPCTAASLDCRLSSIKSSIATGLRPPIMCPPFILP